MRGELFCVETFYEVLVIKIQALLRTPHGQSKTTDQTSHWDQVN